MTAAVSRDYLDRACILLGEAEDACKRWDWALCVLRSAESVEFSLKAILKLVAGSHRREHDVSGDLINAFDKFPEWFKAKVPRISVVSRTLTSLSIPARYGDEMLDVSAKNLFGQDEAETYMKIAKQIYFDCDRLFYEMKHQAP